MSVQSIINRIFSIRGEETPEIDYSEKYKKLKTKEEIQDWLTNNHFSTHNINDDLTVDIYIGSKFTTTYLSKNLNFFPFNISRKSIQEWLEEYKVKNYQINDDLTVDVNGSVDLKNKYLVFIPIQFGNVKGDFDCSFTQLGNTNGFPLQVGGSVNIGGTLVDNLYGITAKIPGSFFCGGNSELTSLKHGPTEVGRDYQLPNTPIKNLKDFDCIIGGEFTSTYRKKGSFHPGAMLPELKNNYIDAKNVSPAYTQKNQAWSVTLSGKDLKIVLDNFYQTKKSFNVK